MYTLEQLPEFENWFSNLKDRQTKLRILSRPARVENGNFGDHKTVEGELKELRMTFGGGIRIYYIIFGNKTTPSRDIKKAKTLVMVFLKED